MATFRVSLVISIIIVLILLIAWSFYITRNEINQPITYNHKIHIEEAGLECSDCHLYVETMASASIPNLEICQDCHSDEPISDSPEEVELLKYIEAGNLIPWKRIYEVPDHVYFSHRRHVVLGELECVNCHGKVSELTEPEHYPFIIASMDNCMDCHRQHKVTNDCLACHR